jgi:hypothetical protein
MLMSMLMLGNGVGKGKEKKSVCFARSLASSGRQAGRFARSFARSKEMKTNTFKGRVAIVAFADRKAQRKEKAPAAPKGESPQSREHQDPKASPPSNTPKQSSYGVANTSEHTGSRYCLPGAAAVAAKSTWA